MLNRLRFIFFGRYQEVKPVTANDPATKWLNMNTNALEALADDARRYGIRIAVGNFAENVGWRNKVYTERQRGITT